MIRRGDWEFLTIVKWTLFGLIEAEEYGVTSANVDKLRAESKDPRFSACSAPPAMLAKARESTTTGW